MILNENLAPNDLDNLILPMISIDEYESKVDDQAMIVVAFYVLGKDPALDLSTYVYKSIVDTEDVDVSPAPTSEGYYIVFVEFNRNKLFASQLLDLIGEINNLTEIKNWQFKSINNKKIYELSKDNIKQHVILDPKKIKPVPKPSDLNKKLVDDKVEDLIKPEEPSEQPTTNNSEQEPTTTQPEEQEPNSPEPTPKGTEDKQQEQLKEQFSKFLRASYLDSFSMKKNHLSFKIKGEPYEFLVQGIHREIPDHLVESVVAEKPILTSDNLGPEYVSFLLEDQRIILYHQDSYAVLKPILTF